MATSKIRNTPSIIEQGTSGIWTYRKWSDGTAECWGYKQAQLALSAWGTWYYVRIDGDDYPTGLFTTMQSVTGSLAWSGGDLVSGVGRRPNSFSTTAPSILGARPNSVSGTFQATAYWHAIGRW